MINDYNNLIRSLDEKCRLIIGNDFQLKRYQSDSHKLLIFHNNGTVKAVNRLGGDADSEVNVYPWFSTYYLYVEVKFVFDTKIFKRKPGIVIAQCSISISVFKLLSEKVGSVSFSVSGVSLQIFWFCKYINLSVTSLAGSPANEDFFIRPGTGPCQDRFWAPASGMTSCPWPSFP